MNNALSILSYQVLLIFVSSVAAYTVAWIIGFIFVILIYPSKVFPQNAPTKTSYIVFALIYLSSFLLGVGVVAALEYLTMRLELIGYDPFFIFFAIIVTALYNFVLMQIFVISESRKS